MRAWRQRATRRIPAEAGFTLVEVVVALVLLTLVTVAVATFFMRAVKSSTGLDRRQDAVAVAGQSMELVRSIPAALDGSGNSKLVSGRYSTSVHSQFTALAASVDLTQTDEASDSTATSSSTPVLTYTATTTVAGVTYTAQRVVGSCWLPTAGGACVKAASKAASSQFMYRAIVLVTWSEGGGTTCSGSACSYTLSTLIDPSADPTFNVNATNAAWPAAPTLTPISASTPMNTPVTVDLATAKTSGATPLTATVGTPTQSANASVLPNTTQVTVTPATGFWSGSTISVPFTLTDPYGQSTSSTLTVTVTPPAAPTAGAGAVSTAQNTPVAVTLSSYISGGTGSLSYSVGSPSSGTLGAVSGAGVTYTPPSNSYGTYTFTYTVSDTYGHNVSNTITVTVPNPCGGVPVANQDGNSTTPFQTVTHGTSATVNVTANDTLPSGCGTATVTVVSSSSNASIGSAAVVSGAVKFTAGSSTGSVTFTYKLTNSLGSSSTVTVYMKVT